MPTPQIDFVLERLIGFVLKGVQKTSLCYWIANNLEKRRKERENVVDVYVVLKFFLSLWLLLLASYFVQVVILKVSLLILVIYFMIETLTALLLKILYSNDFPKPKSYRRTSILVMINYLEFTINFAVLYNLSGALHVMASASDYISSLKTFDYLYFSFVTSVTMGSGDYYLTGYGKLIVIFQIFTFMLFLSLFLTFNFSRLNMNPNGNGV